MTPFPAGHLLSARPALLSTKWHRFARLSPVHVFEAIEVGGKTVMAGASPAITGGHYKRPAD